MIGLGFLAAVSLAQLPQSWPSAEVVRAEAMPGCTERWPDNLALRAACMRNSQEGAVSFRQIRTRTVSVPDMQRALQGCVNRYTDAQGRNWSLIGACARNNLEGLRELGL